MRHKIFIEDDRDAEIHISHLWAEHIGVAWNKGEKRGTILRDATSSKRYLIEIDKNSIPIFTFSSKTENLITFVRNLIVTGYTVYNFDTEKELGEFLSFKDKK